MKARGTGGKHLGKPPYGYMRDPEDKEHWIPDPDAAPVVKRIFALIIDGKGPDQIARMLEAERQGLFSGLLFCADCDSKLHFATCKSFEGKQDHYVCSKYKSGQGDCSAHYIREDVLREIVQERIQAVNEYIRRDVEGFEEEWFRCRRADWQSKRWILHPQTE